MDLKCRCQLVIHYFQEQVIIKYSWLECIVLVDSILIVKSAVRRYLILKLGRVEQSLNTA